MICYIRFLLLLLLLIIGCTSPEAEESELPAHLQDVENLTAYPVEVELVTSITLTQDMIFQSTEENLMVIGGSHGSIVEVDEEGRVYIPDRQQNTIHVLTPDGSYLTRLGRQGRGPGEFGLRSVIKTQLANNRLYVYDSLLSRISIFDLETMSLINTIDLNPSEWSQGGNLSIGAGAEFYVRNDSTILMKASTIADPYNDPALYHYFYIDSVGRRISDIVLQQEGKEPITFQFQGQRGVTSFIHQEKSLFTFSGDSRMIAARTMDFLINIYHPEGESLETIYYSFEKQPLSRDELIEHYDWGFEDPTLNAVRSIELPEF